MEYRCVMGPVTPVKVETEHGVLTFGYRSVVIVDAAGKQVASFSCEDDPGDFDAKALEAGWTRMGDVVNTDGSLPMLRLQPPELTTAASSQRSTGELVKSTVSGVTRLAWMGVLLMILVFVLYGCATAIFGH